MLSGLGRRTTLRGRRSGLFTGNLEMVQPILMVLFVRILEGEEICSNYVDDVETNYNTRDARQVG